MPQQETEGRNPGGRRPAPGRERSARGQANAGVATPKWRPAVNPDTRPAMPPSPAPASGAWPGAAGDPRFAAIPVLGHHRARPAPSGPGRTAATAAQMASGRSLAGRGLRGRPTCPKPGAVGHPAELEVRLRPKSDKRRRRRRRRFGRRGGGRRTARGCQPGFGRPRRPGAELRLAGRRRGTVVRSCPPGVGMTGLQNDPGVVLKGLGGWHIIGGRQMAPRPRAELASRPDCG
jgi:hypothetical protein